MGEVIRHPSAPMLPANELEAELDALELRVDPEPGPCRHPRSSVNLGRRRVACRDCGAELDPLVVLEQVARSRERLILHRRRLEAEIRRLEARVARLVKDERNAKARARRAAG